MPIMRIAPDRPQHRGKPLFLIGNQSSGHDSPPAEKIPFFLENGRPAEHSTKGRSPHTRGSKEKDRQRHPEGAAKSLPELHPQTVPQPRRNYREIKKGFDGSGEGQQQKKGGGYTHTRAEK